MQERWCSSSSERCSLEFCAGNSSSSSSNYIFTELSFVQRSIVMLEQEKCKATEFRTTVCFQLFVNSLGNNHIYGCDVRCVHTFGHTI